jgi:N-dimethylarginine dimethylaminohydrolase
VTSSPWRSNRLRQPPTGLVRTRRPKTICISSGRPISRLSAHSVSKNPRAARGVCSTRVRETSTCRIAISHQYPPVRSCSVAAAATAPTSAGRTPGSLPARGRRRCVAARWGRALFFGATLLVGSGWRTDDRMHGFLADAFECTIVSLQTVGSQWYDIDLAIAVLDAERLAYCRSAFDASSRCALDEIASEAIEVGLYEAETCFALNLVSDGHSVTMPAGAPRLVRALSERGYRVVELGIEELRKGGGGVRCTSLEIE